MDDRDLVFRALNLARARHTRPALERDAALDALAQSHANTMAAEDRPMHVSGGPEVVGRGYADALVCVDGWLGTWPDRGNVLGPFRKVGTGVARSDRGTPYWCAAFA